MAAHGGAQPGGGFSNGQVLLLATAIVLPGIAPAYFGWLTGLLAIPVFCLLGLHGTARGSILVRNALLLAAMAALLLKLLGTLLFALNLILLGYSFHRSAAVGSNEWKTVFTGCLYLGASWVLLWKQLAALPPAPLERGARGQTLPAVAVVAARSGIRIAPPIMRHAHVAHLGVHVAVQQLAIR